MKEAGGMMLFPALQDSKGVVKNLMEHYCDLSLKQRQSTSPSRWSLKVYKYLVTIFDDVLKFSKTEEILTKFH